jgi:hypothetical protein
MIGHNIDALRRVYTSSYVPMATYIIPKTLYILSMF